MIAVLAKDCFVIAKVPGPEENTRLEHSFKKYI